MGKSFTIYNSTQKHSVDTFSRGPWCDLYEVMHRYNWHHTDQIHSAGGYCSGPCEGGGFRFKTKKEKLQAYIDNTKAIDSNFEYDPTKVYYLDPRGNILVNELPKYPDDHKGPIEYFLEFSRKIKPFDDNASDLTASISEFDDEYNCDYDYEDYLASKNLSDNDDDYQSGDSYDARDYVSITNCTDECNDDDDCNSACSESSSISSNNTLIAYKKELISVNASLQETEHELNKSNRKIIQINNQLNLANEEIKFLNADNSFLRKHIENLLSGKYMDNNFIVINEKNKWAYAEMYNYYKNKYPLATHVTHVTDGIKYIYHLSGEYNKSLEKKLLMLIFNDSTFMQKAASKNTPYLTSHCPMWENGVCKICNYSFDPDDITNDRDPNSEKMHFRVEVIND